MHSPGKIILTFYFGPSGLPLGHSCADGLRQLGWEVCCVDTHHEHFLYRYGIKRLNKLLKALRLRQVTVEGRGWFWTPLQHRANRLKRAVSSFKPDVVLVFNPFPNLYSSEFLLELRKQFGFRLIGWNVDGPYDDLIAHSKKDAPVFDRYCCIHRFGYSQADRIEYLPAYALDPKRYYRRSDAPPEKHGVVFVGAWSPRREEYLRAIADLPLEIYGTAWHRRGSPETRRCVVANRIWGDKLVLLMNQSKIVLNISSWPPGKTGLSLRVVDIPATGAFMLTDETSELGEIFGEEMPLPTFTDPADLRAKVLYYLNTETERREIAERMYQHIKHYDTYADRMRQLVSY